MLIVNSKYNSRKFIVTILALLLEVGITIWAINKISSAKELSEIIQTAIMWVGLTSSTYVGGNAVVNLTNNKNGRKKENTNSENTDNPNYSIEP